MNRKAFPKCLVLFAAMFLLFATPVIAPFAKAYPAQITAKGTLTLKGFSGQEDINLPIDVSFMSMVPDIIKTGSYDAEFRGFAIVDKKGTIKFEGLLGVGGIHFWIQFALEKPPETEIPEGRYSVFSKEPLKITISEATLPPLEITWVMMKGIVTKFGQSEAFGGIMAHAKISESNNWTKVHSTFTLKPPGEEAEMQEEAPPSTEEALRKLNCSFYVVNLATTTKTELNNGESDLYIEGSWNVYNRTCTVILTDSMEATINVTWRTIFEGAPGKLSATYDPSQFTLKITGLDDISGFVTFFHVKFAKPFERGIPRGDFNRDRKVNIQDIMQIAKAYRSRLGEPGYNFDLDLNPDFIINIADLTAVALEYGQAY